MSTREKIDFFLNKWVSRKLTVFVVGSVALFLGNLTSSDWVIIATTYIFIEGVTTIVEKLMKAKGGIL
jgi:hypothetical protein